MKQLYCPVCRTKLINHDHCEWCGANLDMIITPTKDMIPEYKEKIGVG